MIINTLGIVKMILITLGIIDIRDKLVARNRKNAELISAERKGSCILYVPFGTRLA